LFDCNKYAVFRKDRDTSLTGKVMGGGVIIAVSKEFYSEEAVEFDNILDCICVRVRVGPKRWLYVSVVYFPPNTNIQLYKSYYNMLSLVPVVGNDLLIMGDFNIPRYIAASGYGCELTEELCLFQNLMNAVQLNEFVNYKGKLLDLVITNIDSMALESVRSEDAVVPVDNYHPALNCNFEVSVKVKEAPRDSESYNFKKGDYMKLYEELKGKNWEILNTIDTVDSAVDHFYKLTYEAMDRAIPKCRKCRYKYPKWYTRDIIKKLKSKDRHRQKYRRKGSLYHYHKFTMMRRELRQDIQKAHELYIANVQDSISAGDSKTFWEYIKSGKSSETIPDEMVYGDKRVETASEIVELFAEYFSSVYTPRDGKAVIADCEQMVSGTGGSPCIEKTDVLEAIRKLKPKKSVGDDMIPSYIVKACKDIFAGPLCCIFNLCLAKGIFPKTWKTAKVCPIFKKGNKREVSNYRPVSILSVFSRVFECILYQHLYSGFKASISNFQHGFTKGRSTVSNLGNFTEFVCAGVDEGSQVDVIYTDFGKAFDTVDHELLIWKLKMVEVSPKVIELIRSYLDDRQQYVVFKNYNSAKYTAVSGVPQGSNLGPLLFLIFVNDLPEKVNNSKIMMFADDVKIYHKINIMEDCYELQDDLNQLSDWSTLNKLPFNVKKCCVLSFSRKVKSINYSYNMRGVELEKVACHKDLGVTFTSNLDYNKHIQEIVSSSMRSLGFVLRCTKGFTKIKPMIVLYMALVRSRLEYCASIWSPYYRRYIEIIEKVQKRFLRGLYLREKGKYPIMENYVPTYRLLELYNMQSLEVRRSINDLVYLYDVVNSVNDSHLIELIDFYVPKVHCRNNRLFIRKGSNTRYGENSPVKRMCDTYNKFARELDIFGPRCKYLKSVNACFEN
jgi:hypothetical protein